MKKVLRFKFENLIALSGFILFTYGMIEHQIMNGFSLNNLFYESLFYYSITMVCRYAIKEVRFNLQQMI
ncbi:MAG: hypothetical protein IKO78_02750 [Bacilli bacterium]|nr:hypothetical protein [Bacilli bacterium]